MQLQFEHPWYLLLWPVLMALVIYSARWMRSKSHTRKIGEILLRGLVLLCIIAAIAGPGIRFTNEMTTTIFLVDLSDSMKDHISEEADFVRQAIGSMPDKNQAGIVVFGQDSRIEQFVSDKKAFTDFETQTVTSATNLEQAVSTALALFPSDSAKRLVLLTDGKENEGDLSHMSALCTLDERGVGVEVKALRFEEVIGEEAYVSEVILPKTIHEGDEFEVRVKIFSTVSCNARVSLFSGRSLKGERQVSLQKGENQLIFLDKGLEGGLKSYRVTVDAEKDSLTVNNSYSAFTTVEAKARILLVEGKSGEAKAFEKVLQAGNFDYDLVTPGGVPNKISDLAQYQSVVLVDVYATDFRKGFLDTLQSYVKDYAGGLVTVGGENSFALGAYRNTPLEELLPVSIDLEGEKQVPSIAMVMVIDHSGSMSSPSMSVSASVNFTCMDVAKQAAANAVDSYRPIDEIGVLAFDDSYSWVVPLQKAENPDECLKKIATIAVEGGTSIYPAVAEAAKALKASPAAIKHIVLMTDGQDGYHQYEPLYKELEEYDITLSSVAIGQDADVNTLKTMAERGHGRYYYTDAGTDMPRIFAQEVFMSTESYLKNHEFVPALVNSHAIAEGVFEEGSPSLFGYIATSPKSLSTTILESDEEDPILSVWQYGLGKSVAWTSDVSGKWSGNFSGWQPYAKLWKNIIDWSVTDSDPGEDVLSISKEGSQAIIHYETKEFGADTRISALLSDEEGNRQEVQLKAKSPSVYEASVPLNQVGVYTVNLRNARGDTIIKNINTATAMQYSREYRVGESYSSLEKFLTQTGGREIKEVSEVFDSKLSGAANRKDLSTMLLTLGLLLFVVDTIFRRMRVDWIGVFTGFFGKISIKNSKSIHNNVNNMLTSGDKSVEKPKKSVYKSVDNVKNSVDNRGKDINNPVNKVENDGNRRFDDKNTQKTSKTGNKGTLKVETDVDKSTSSGKESTNDGKLSTSGGKDSGKAQAIDTAALLKKKKKRDSQE